MTDAAVEKVERDGTAARKEEKQQSTTGCGNAGGIPTFTLAAAIIFTICKKL